MNHSLNLVSFVTFLSCFAWTCTSRSVVDGQRHFWPFCFGPFSFISSSKQLSALGQSLWRSKHFTPSPMFSHPYPHLPPEQPLTNSTSLLYQSPPFSIQTSPSTSPATKDMKDVSATKSSRASFYPKKRPSPHGVVKSHKSPLLPACGPVRRSPRFAKSTLNQQKQREAQILALRQQGILLEEEY